jgi:Domain of unknown function (DUF4878)
VRRLPVLIVAIALAGCGGGEPDRGDAERVIRDFAKAVSDSDGEKFCKDLVTREYLEQTTGATGDNAVSQCVKQIDAQRGSLKILKIDKTEIDGDRATVTAQVDNQGQEVPQVFRLEKQDGEFRLTGNRP